MSSLSTRVRRAIARRGLLADDDRVAVAVSGGSDSVALAWILRALEPDASWRLVGVIHVNHGLRGEESDADEAFCRALAARIGLPIEVHSLDVRQRAIERKQSVETTARVERYACFDRAARTLGATRVATGHTMDDQAETVLLRLLRGAGGRGVSAIRARRGKYVRPLLDCRRAELQAELESRGERWRDDSSNLDLAIPRNRVRHTLLPVITQFWPGSVVALARFAELAADDERFLDDTAREVSSAVALPGVDGVQTIDLRGLNQLPPALARRMVRRALEAAGGAATFVDVEAVRSLGRADKEKGHLDLHGVDVERRGATLQFRGRVAGRRPPVVFEYPLPIPGRADVRETGMTILASFSRGKLARPRAGEPATVAVLRADAVKTPLIVRNRRRGDRMRPLGSPGSRKVQDVLVDHKVPRDARDLVPLVVDATGRIAWVVGIAIAEECRVTTPESGVVILELKGNQ